MRHSDPLVALGMRRHQGTYLQILGDMEWDPTCEGPPRPPPGPAALTLGLKQKPHSSMQMSTRALWLGSTWRQFPQPRNLYGAVSVEKEPRKINLPTAEWRAK